MPGVDPNSAPKAAASVKEPMDVSKKLRLQKAAKDFEAVLVGYMLKSMRSSIQKAGEAGDSFGSETIEGMFDSEVARSMSKNGSFGIADMMYKKLAGEPMPKHPAPTTGLPALHKKFIPAAVHAPLSPPAAPAAHVRTADITVPAAAVPPATPTPAHRVQAAHGHPHAAHRAPASAVERIASLSSIIDTAADEQGVDVNLLKAVIATESGGRTDVQSNKSAKGVMQIIDSTAADLGITNVWDPEQNIQGGARYLRQLLDRFDGDTKLAVASYNAGPGAVEKHNGVPPIPETRAYVKRVMDYLQQFEHEGVKNAD